MVSEDGRALTRPSTIPGGRGPEEALTLCTEGELEAKLASKGRMLKKRVTKDDGRYLIYYRFESPGDRTDPGPSNDMCSSRDSAGAGVRTTPTGLGTTQAESVLGDRSDLGELGDNGSSSRPGESRDCEGCGSEHGGGVEDV